MHGIALAARSLGRSPRLAAAIVACIAISIAGAATVLTFVHSLLLRPLPFPDAERLVMFMPEGPKFGPGSRPYLSYANFADLRANATSFETLDGASVSRLVMVTGNGAERLRGEVITPGYFSLFGLIPQAGRRFTRDEFEGNGEKVVLISDRLWRSHFGAREDLVGSPVETRIGPVVIAGIMPRGFLGIAEDEGTDYWIPERQHNVPMTLTDRMDPVTLVFGRLKEGTTVTTATAEARRILAALEQSFPDANRGVSGHMRPLGEKWRADLRPGLLMMLVASFFLLAIGCANVAILLLARLGSRETEIGIRQALGATQAAVARFVTLQGLRLVAQGLLLGLGLVAAFGGVLESRLYETKATDPASLLIVAGSLLAAAAVIAWLPARRTSRISPLIAMRSE